jgi:hypothetical protein
MNLPGPRRISPWRIGVLLLFCFAFGGVLLTQRDALRAHRQYFMESRPEAVLDLAQLSDRWTEATMRDSFPGVPVTCYDYHPTEWVDRVCVLEARAVIAIPTLFSSFCFKAGHLRVISFNLPWWVKQDARAMLTRAFGAPYALDAPEPDGTLLDEWRPADGSSLTMNRYRSWNPLRWNWIEWRAPPARKPARTGA